MFVFIALIPFVFKLICAICSTFITIMTRAQCLMIEQCYSLNKVKVKFQHSPPFLMKRQNPSTRLQLLSVSTVAEVLKFSPKVSYSLIFLVFTLRYKFTIFTTLVLETSLVLL